MDRLLQNMLYFYIDDELSACDLSGMTPQQFFCAVPEPVNKILLLRHEDDLGGDKISIFDTLEGEKKVQCFLQNSQFAMGSLCFTDYEDHQDATRISKEDIAELLYLAYYVSAPLQSAFFDCLKNKFVYLGHDHDWYCRLYFRRKEWMASLLANLILNRTQEWFQKTLPPVQPDVEQAFFELSHKGMLVDFAQAHESGGELYIPFYLIGQAERIDDLYNKQIEWRNYPKNEYSVRMVPCCYQSKDWAITAVYQEKGKAKFL